LEERKRIILASFANIPKESVWICIWSHSVELKCDE